MGFIGKDEARELLLQKPEGTFLLRFSDGILGGISVAYVINDQGILETFIGSCMLLMSVFHNVVRAQDPVRNKVINHLRLSALPERRFRNNGLLLCNCRKYLKAEFANLI